MTRLAGHKRLPYVGALDGLRGAAVAAVLLFHADLTWARGGHLGVTVFFTLSGFLITSLLLVERHQTGTVALWAFWARRARRLVPAALVCFGLIAAVLALSGTPPHRGLVGDAVAAATWVANWRFVFAGQTYADIFSSPSPFQHFWSLAVEEQFYLVFPLLALAVLGRGTRARRGCLTFVLASLVVASTVQAARLHDPGDAIGRAYYGTDARVAEILVGALLALALVGPSGIKVLAGAPRRVVGALGGAGFVGLLAAFSLLGDRDTRLYDGGFLAVAVCTAAVIASAVQPGSALGRLLENRPTVALGKISYGTYLFHWPVFILLTEQSTGLAPAPLLAARVGVTLVLAGLSYALVEAPIRFGRLPARVGLIAWANGAVAGLALVALTSGQLVSTAPSIGHVVPTSGDVASGAPVVGGGTVAPPAAGTATATASGPAVGAGPLPAVTELPRGSAPAPPVPAALIADPGGSKVPPVPYAAPGALRVAVVGDSVGVNIGTGLGIWAQERGDVVVYNLAVPACPISRGGERRLDGNLWPISEECGWWGDPSSDRAAALERFSPDVVVVEDGVNELFDRKLPEWGDYRHAGDVRFDRWLRDEYGVASSGWARSGAKIVMLNAPCADWDRYEAFRSMQDIEARVQALNLDVYRMLAGVVSADLFDRICPGGQYTDEVEGVQDGRPDGIHFSDDAAAALARNWLGPIVLDAA